MAQAGFKLRRVTRLLTYELGLAFPPCPRSPVQTSHTTALVSTPHMLTTNITCVCMYCVYTSLHTKNL